MLRYDLKCKFYYLENLWKIIPKLHKSLDYFYI
jgi:hypothetical protein